MKIPKNKPRFSKMSELYTIYDSLSTSERVTLRKTTWENYGREYDRLPRRFKKTIDPNHGQFRSAINSKLSEYVDIITERNSWAKIRTLIGDTEEKRAYYSRCITDAFQKFCISLWKERGFNSSLDIKDMLMFGKGHEWFPKKLGIFPEHISSERVLVNEGAGVHSKSWDILFVTRRFSYLALLDLANDDDNIEGWKKDAVERLIESNIDKSHLPLERYRAGEEPTSLQNEEVDIVYAYVKERGGKITRYLFPAEYGQSTESGKASNKARTEEEKQDYIGFLSVKPNWEDSMCDVLNVRTITFENKYYKSDSYADSIYIQSVFYNKTMNRLIRAGIRSVHLIMTASSPEAKKRLEKIDGNDEVTILPPETGAVTLPTNQNWQGLMEILRQVDFDAKSARRDPITTGSQNVKGRAITAAEVKSNVSTFVGSQSAEHKIFSMHEAHLLSAIYRRFMDKDRIVPDSIEEKGKELFLQYMKGKGVPEKAYDPDLVIISSSMEFGAAGVNERIQLTERLLQAIRQYVASQTDGEKRAAAEIVGAIVGKENAQYYLPQTEKLRAEAHEAFRIGSENNDLYSKFLNPENVPVSEEDNHPLHIEGHALNNVHYIQIAQQIIQSTEGIDNLIDLKMNIDELREIAIGIDNTLSHMEAHLAIVGPAAATTPEIKAGVDGFVAKMTEQRSVQAAIIQQIEKLTELQQQLSETSDTNTEQLRHTKMMNEEQERHARAMNDVKLSSQIDKGALNRTGAVLNAEVKQSQKEQEHQQKLRQKEEENELIKNKQGKAGGTGEGSEAS